jgi:hypothetical protein
MFKTLFALFMLPVLGVLLLVGVIVEAAQAQPPADPPPPGRAAGATGGPYQPLAADSFPADSFEPGAERWRVTTDSREERRFAPPPQRPLNGITIRF